MPTTSAIFQSFLDDGYITDEEDLHTGPTITPCEFTAMARGAVHWTEGEQSKAEVPEVRSCSPS